LEAQVFEEQVFEEQVFVAQELEFLVE
jgi:hypothetical protein